MQHTNKTDTKKSRLQHVTFSGSYNFRKSRYRYCHIRYHNLDTTRSSATAERQRVSYTRLFGLTH